jgi:hypothetical protein
MTPKEKAIELLDKMYGVTDYQAKKSALVAVNEILNNVMFFWYSPTKDMPKDIAYFVTQRKYWEEVKNEIEKL